jgi:hypothetical protein
MLGNIINGKNSQKRIDLLLINCKYDKIYALDIKITRPTMPTSLGTSKGEVCTIPLYAADNAAKAKNEKYNKNCNDMGWSFIACILETYGGIGKELNSLLIKLMETYGTTPEEKQEFLIFAKSLLSVTLQCGNSTLIYSGIEQLIRYDYDINTTGNIHPHYTKYSFISSPSFSQSKIRNKNKTSTYINNNNSNQYKKKQINNTNNNNNTISNNNTNNKHKQDDTYNNLTNKNNNADNINNSSSIIDLTFSNNLHSPSHSTSHNNNNHNSTSSSIQSPLSLSSDNTKYLNFSPLSDSLNYTITENTIGCQFSP